MKLKHLLIGAGVLTALAVLFIAINARRNEPAQAGRVGQPMIADLGMEQVARITLTTETTVTLEKGAEGAWVVAEQGRFIADEGKLRTLLLQFTRISPEHQVTDREERLADLQLLVPDAKLAPDKKDKAGVLITLLDEKGQPLHRVLLGKVRQNGGGQYVRFPDEPAAYLIGDVVRVEPDSADWIAKSILNEDSAVIASVRVERPGESGYEFFREKAESPWQVRGNGAQTLNQDEVRILANTLASLDVARVAPEGANAKTLGRERVANIAMTLFDGRRYAITVGAAKAGEYRYLAVEGALTGKEQDEAKKSGMERFNRLYQGRFFAVFDYDGERMQRPMKEFLAKAK